MNLRLEFRLTLLADYHVGSGHRFGATVDSSLLRDYDQAPLLRGTALAGLLRDGLLDLSQLPPCRAIDETTWKNATERLFGSAAARKCWAYSSARADDSGINEKAGRWGAQDVMRMQIDLRTRRSAPQALFSQEEGDARLTFTFTATCLHPTVQDEDDAALIVAVARMVRHLGSARRRGRGECRITLLKADGLPGGEDWTQEEALSEFKRRWLEPAPPETAPEEPDKPPRNLTATAEAGKRRLRFRLIAHADEPVIVAKRSEAANAYESLLTIPGSSVLGALASQAARALGLKIDESAPPDFIALFARGGVRVTGLSLAQKDADQLYPSISTPHDSFVCEVYPKHRMIPYASKGEPPPDPRCDRCSAGLIEWAKTTSLVTVRRQPQPLQPQQREEAHITLNPETGRVLTGNLYEYIALEAGQWFTGELECANEACWLALQDLLGFAERKTLQIRLGKATQRGYGLLTFFMERMDETAPSPWVLRPLENRVASATETLTMLLLTDAIVTDVWGRYEENFAEHWIAELFWPTAKGAAKWIKLRGQYASTRDVDSFNGARHAPRWRDRAVAAGSSVGIEITPDGLAALVSAWRVAEVDSREGIADELAALRWRIGQIEAEGIGLRTHEGFGRVAFNHPVYAPGSDLAEGLAIEEWPEGFKQSAKTTPLIEEAKFHRHWDEKLTEWAQSAKDNAKEIRLRRENWEALQDAAFEPVARLLYLCRQRDANFVREKLDELKKGATLSTYLWDKKLPERIREQSKLNPKGLELIADLIKQLEGQKAGYGDAAWTIGLELLAARLAELSHQAKPGKERR